MNAFRGRIESAVRALAAWEAPWGGQVDATVEEEVGDEVRVALTVTHCRMSTRWMLLCSPAALDLVPWDEAARSPGLADAVRPEDLGLDEWRARDAACLTRVLHRLFAVLREHHFRLAKASTQPHVPALATALEAQPEAAITAHDASHAPGHATFFLRTPLFRDLDSPPHSVFRNLVVTAQQSDPRTGPGMSGCGGGREGGWGRVEAQGAFRLRQRAARSCCAQSCAHVSAAAVTLQQQPGGPLPVSSRLRPPAWDLARTGLAEYLACLRAAVESAWRLRKALIEIFAATYRYRSSSWGDLLQRAATQWLGVG